MRKPLPDDQNERAFAWEAVCEHAQPPCWFQADYWLHISTSNSPLWFQVYVDRRFGSLLIDYVPAPAA